MATFTELYEQVLKRLEGGGTALQADLADIEEGKRQAVAGGEQRLVSGGLGGTTVMGAVPLAAEKTAGRARLKARGEAESKYMGAMMSFANVAEGSRQAELEREAAMDRTKLMAGTQFGLAQYQAQQRGLAERTATYAAREAQGRSDNPYFQDLGGGGGGRQAQQFPALYDQGGGYGGAPDWTGGGGATGQPSQWTSGGYAGSINGERYVYDAEGQTIKESDLGQQTQQDVTAGLPQTAQPGGGGDLYSRMMAARSKWQSFGGGFGPEVTKASQEWESLYKQYRASGGGPLG